MKILKIIWQWLNSIFRPLIYKTTSREIQTKERDPNEYELIITDEIPLIFNQKCIYILNEGHIDEAIYFVCPCGCNAIIELNLLEDSKPLWKYSTNERRLTISPSIWRTIHCKSHFFIRQGKVQWVED